MPALRHSSAMFGPRPNICVVEDDAAVADSLRWMLDRNGYAVRLFASPAEFLASEELDRFDCLILDLQLPGMSGLELLELLRRRAYAKPVVLIAARRYRQLESRMQNAGVDSILLKPLSSNTLLAALHNSIGTSSSLRT